MTARRANRAIAAALLAAALAGCLAPAPPGAAVPTSPPPTASPPPTPTPPPPTPTPPPPTPTPIPTTQLVSGAEVRGEGVTFTLRGDAPGGAAEALLWYDAAGGREILTVPLGGGSTISATLTISAADGLTLAREAGRTLDFWWAVRDGSGALARSAGSLELPEALARTEPPTATDALARGWVLRETPHFRLFAPPGSDGERDLARIASVAEASYAQAAALVPPERPISVTVYLVPRVFWQGGVAYRDGPLIISYTDRNYAGVAPWSYLVHEVTHAFGDALLPEDAEVGGVLGEGLAVAASGGHYAVEPIDARAAALLQTGQLIRLCALRYDFYAAQHETAYIQSASYVRFLDRTYGRDALLAMYRAQQAQRGGRDQPLDTFCAADEAIVEAAVGVTRGELERAWRDYLAALAPTEAERAGIALTVRLYDTMRRYQERLDPPARTLPSIPEEWDQAMAEQMLTPAAARLAATVETLLIAAAHATRAEESDRAAAILDDVDATVAAGAPTGPFARDHDAIAALLETQARAMRLGLADDLAATLARPGMAGVLPVRADELALDLRLTLNRLDVRGDRAEAIVEVRGVVRGGLRYEGDLYRARFQRRGAAWLLAEWVPHPPLVEMPPAASVQQ